MLGSHSPFLTNCEDPITIKVGFCSSIDNTCQVPEDSALAAYGLARAPSSTSTDDDSLSTGHLAAVVVGSVLGAMIIFVVGVLLGRKMRQKSDVASVFLRSATEPLLLEE